MTRAAGPTQPPPCFAIQCRSGRQQPFSPRPRRAFATNRVGSPGAPRHGSVRSPGRPLDGAQYSLVGSAGPLRRAARVTVAFDRPVDGPGRATQSRSNRRGAPVSAQDNRIRSAGPPRCAARNTVALEWPCHSAERRARQSHSNRRRAPSCGAQHGAVTLPGHSAQPRARAAFEAAWKYAFQG